MVETIKRMTSQGGIKLQIVPVEYLSEIKADIEILKESEELNDLQKWITNERYILDEPKFAFEPKSIVVAAVKLELVHAVFHREGLQVSDILESSKSGIMEYMTDLFRTHGFHLEYVHWLPQKRLAVRSGLAEYGRNNITYIPGWGSFIQLYTFFSDIPCGEHIWRDVKSMDNCGDCELCVQNCPTGAILPDRFLIDNERCLTHHNEWGTHPFPDWMAKSVHHRIFGCIRCQDVCPMNRETLSGITKIIDFSEEETKLLLAGAKKENMPHSLIQKAEQCNLDLSFKSLPRNLKAMFDSVKDLERYAKGR